MAVKVSVIIPVYNVEKYLRECLDSVVNQTLKEIEIICVDDGSTDESAAILKEYERSYDNVHCLYYSERRSASQARKDAVLKASGNYIMFLDSDDYLEQNACEVAYKAIVSAGVEMLQFDCVVENCGHLPAERIAMNQKAVSPRAFKRITGNLLQACFIDNKFSFTLWNKIYNGDLCHRAALNVNDGYYPKANDLYLAFFILNEAKSYFAIKDSLYHYNFGRGMTGHNTLSEADFSLCCQSARVYHAISQYLEDFPDKRFDCQNALTTIKKNLMNEQVNKWLNNLGSENKRAGLTSFYKAWGEQPFEIIGDMANILQKKRTAVAKFVNDNIATFEFENRRNIRTVALYYRNISNGGAQRVVADLANKLAEYQEDGEYVYKVILVTSEQAGYEEYDISPRVIRYHIPSKKESAEDYCPRAQALWNLISNYSVDLFINSMWVESLSLWDYLAIKFHPSHPLYFVHAHNFCGYLWGTETSRIEELNEFYKIVDGIIVLSQADRYYWSIINPNTYYIPNPSFALNRQRGKKLASRGGTVLWLGRISKEKQPVDVLRIIERVVAEIPDVRCCLVGDGDERLKQNLMTYIETHGLSKNVIMEGYHKDVKPFYEQADVFLFTSWYEGFPLTLFESASYGIPTVTYDLPWLEYYNLIDGWYSVPQRDVQAAAERVITLLSDQTEWNERSNRIYNSYKEYASINVLSEWVSLFKQYEAGGLPKRFRSSDDINYLLLSQLGSFHTMAVVDLRKKLKKEQKKNENLKRSFSFRLGRFLTAIPRKIRSLLRNK